MALRHLSDEQRDTIRQAVIAVRDGGYVPRDDIYARIGVSLDAMNAFMNAWPEIDDRDDESDATLIINNSLNEICHGVDVPNRDWARWFSVPREAVKQTYRTWTSARGWPATGVR